MHLPAVRAIANGATLEDADNELIALLLRDMQTYQFPMKAHTQSTERGVNWMSYCTANQKSEPDADGLFIWSSFLKGTVRDLLTKNASERLMHNNQHRINGVAISNVAKRKEVKRLKAGSETVYRVQPTAEVGAALIRETLTNFVQSENQRKATKTVLKNKIEGGEYISKKKARLQKNLDETKHNLTKNEQKKAAGKKYRNVDDIKVISVDLPDTLQSTIAFSKLCCTKNRSYFEKELDARKIDYRPTDARNQNPLGITKLKVMMLWFELQERAKSESNISAVNLDHVQDATQLLALLKQTQHKDRLKLLHDDHTLDQGHTILTLLNNTAIIRAGAG